MKYEDSACSMEELIEADAFSIERHALRISQPITVYSDFADDNDGLVDGVRLNCRIEGLGSRFGQVSIVWRQRRKFDILGFLITFFCLPLLAASTFQRAFLIGGI
jgi:hypothetical protein